MRLNNKTFKIGTFRRRRRKLGRISNFKWLEAALNLVEIKNPFGSVQTNPQADAWWVPLFIFLKKCFFETPYYTLQYRQCRERALQRSGRKSQHLLCPVTLLMTLSYLPAQITNRNTLWATTQIISLGEKLLFCTFHMSLMMVVTTQNCFF